MKVSVRKFLFILVASVSFFGFYQLNYQKDVFDSSMYYCCNNGNCNNHDCSFPATVKITGDGCVQDYLIDCYTCMDYNAAGIVCDPSVSCCLEYINGNWEPYCGNPAKH